MSLVIGLLIVAAAVAFVVAPFFRTEPEAEAAVPGGQPASDRDRLERQKLAAYGAIKESEFDYRMGKLSETDFSMLRDKYSAQALEAIAAQEAHSARQRQEPRRPARIAYCPGCGHGVPPRAGFCPACGRSLKEAVA